MPNTGIFEGTTSRSQASEVSIQGSRFGTFEADPVMMKAATPRGSGGGFLRTSTVSKEPRHSSPIVSLIMAAKGPRFSSTPTTGSPIWRMTILGSEDIVGDPSRYHG